MATIVACECGAKNQTPDYITTDCLLCSPPRGTAGLIRLDEDTTNWLQQPARTFNEKLKRPNDPFWARFPASRLLTLSSYSSAAKFLFSVIFGFFVLA